MAADPRSPSLDAAVEAGVQWMAVVLPPLPRFEMDDRDFVQGLLEAALPYLRDRLREPAAGLRDGSSWTIWKCPLCPEVMSADGVDARCAGSQVLGTAHEPCSMVKVDVAPSGEPRELSEQRWTDDEGQEGVILQGRLSIFGKPSMTSEDGTVAVGIDLPAARPREPSPELREKVETLVDALLPLLHVQGSDSGYRVSTEHGIGSVVAADPEEWATAAHHFCEVHAALAALREEQGGQR